MKSIVIAPLLVLGALTSCQSYGPEANRGAATGALIGAAAGGVIGNQSGRALEGAAIGAAGGAAVGGAYGNAQDQENHRRRSGYYGY